MRTRVSLKVRSVNLKFEGTFVNFPPRQIADFMSEVLVVGLAFVKNLNIPLPNGKFIPLDQITKITLWRRRWSDRKKRLKTGYHGAG